MTFTEVENLLILKEARKQRGIEKREKENSVKN